MTYEEKTQKFATFGSKLLMHADRLNEIQQGNWRPINIQLSLLAACDSYCDFCSVKERTMKHRLTLEQVQVVLQDFKELGAKALELSVKGDELISYKNDNDEICVDTIKNIVEQRKKFNSFTINEDKKFEEDCITNWISHPQKESLFKITLATGRNITVTKSHSIYFLEEGNIMKKPVSNCRIGEVVVLNKAKPTSSSKDKIGDYTLTNSLARLIGYFVAEGNHSFQREKVPHGICFTFGSKENERERKYIEDVEKIIEELGFNAHTYDLGNKNQIYLFSKDFCKLFLSMNIGRKANVKRVPDVIFNASYELKINFLKGLFGGDGNYRDYAIIRNGINVGYRNSLHLKTSSKILQQTLGLLFDYMDIDATFLEGLNRIRYIEGRQLPETEYYVVSVSNKKYIDKLIEVVHWLDKEPNYKGGIYSHHKEYNKKIEISNDCYGLKIKKIEELDIQDEKVYDISIGKTHRFLSSYNILCSNTGGGNPMLYPKINEVIEFAHQLEYKIGIISNTENPGRILTKENARRLSWYRCSLTKLEEGKTVDDFDFSIIPKGRLGMSHIMNVKTTPETIKQIAELVKRNPDVKFVRIAGNCLDPKSIESVKQKWNPIIKKVDEFGKFFIKEIGTCHTAYPHFCGVGPIRPYVYDDGYIYICTSHVLMKRRVLPEYRIGHIDDIKGMYERMNAHFEKTGRPYDIDIAGCGECFYHNNNKLLHTVVGGHKKFRHEDADFA